MEGTRERRYLSARKEKPAAVILGNARARTIFLRQTWRGSSLVINARHVRDACVREYARIDACVYTHRVHLPGGTLINSRSSGSIARRSTTRGTSGNDGIRTCVCPRVYVRACVYRVYACDDRIELPIESLAPRTRRARRSPAECARSFLQRVAMVSHRIYLIPSRCSRDVSSRSRGFR